MPISILMYHDVLAPEVFSASTQNIYTITTTTFQDHLAEIARSKLPVLNILELLDGINNQSLPASGVVLSFDDGCYGNYQHAYPLLRERGWPGVFFVSTGIVGTDRGISWAGLKEMSQNGMSIQSHGHSHRRLEGLSAEEVDRELINSKQLLEDNLGTTVDALSLPGGGIPFNLESYARKTGYRLVATSIPAVVDNATSVFDVPRLAVKNRQTLKEFSEMIHGNESWVKYENTKYRLKNTLKSFLPQWLIESRHRK